MLLQYIIKIGGTNRAQKTLKTSWAKYLTINDKCEKFLPSSSL